jgi:hypothetical protein
MTTMWLPKYCAWGIALVVCSGTLVEAQDTTTRVSVATGGAQATGGGSLASLFADLSDDGRYVAFTSTSTNLVAGDTNSVQDIFVHDRQTGSTTRVSVGPGGAQANGPSAGQSISGDGRFVAFQSAATNLVAGDTNGLADCFVHDRQTGVTTRVSVATGGAQATGGPNFITAISANGRFVAFYSSATNLVAGDTNALQDVFRHDRQTGTTVRVSVATGGAQAAGQGSFGPFISSDGRFVGFYSGATNLVPGDTNGVSDVFIHDVQTATTSRVSLGPGGTQANAESLVGSFSNDGRFVCFESFATNLEPGGGIGAFIHDRQTGVTSPVAVVPSSAAAQKPTEPKISGNGRFVIFGTLEALAPDDTNGQGDVYLRDLQTTTTTRVSVATGGGQGNAFSGTGAVNQNGSVIAFPSSSTNLVSGDTNGAWDIFVRNIPGNGSGTLPTMTLDKTSLRFAAVTNGAAFLAQTASQVVRLTQSGSGTVTWTATSNQPWLQVSPASGTGSANLSLSVVSAGGLAPGATVNGAITLVLTGAFGGAGPVNVALTVYANGTTVGPFGNVDTPVNNVTGITGAVPFTGWALDDIEVQRVTVCRSAFGAEVAPIDPNCGGTAQIFVGVAVFIDGARPDVAAAYPAFPVNTRGGWGFMVLTNTLPSQGNGTFVFHMWAQDRDGHTIVLGTRTMTCANASSILPFGAIDTPTQGGVASGAFNVFGWVLSRTNRADPPGGGTVIVQVDGVTVGSPGGWTSRPDLTGLFPGFPGISTALAVFGLNTTSLTNGLHTIQWVATDNTGRVEGIGSRFFTVSNGAGAMTAAGAMVAMTGAGEASAQAARRATNVEAIADAPLDSRAIVGRRGWDLAAPYVSFAAGGSGRVVVRSEEVNRVELRLGPAEHYTGHLRTSDGLSPLPIGSHLDATTGVFTWAPGVGFVGAYDLVFVRWDGAAAVARHEVRIILDPKGSHLVGPQVVIDSPRSQQDVGQPFHLGGWAADLNAGSGTGIATLHAWAYPLTGGPPVFLGATSYGGARPDVGAAHGDQFAESGFGLTVQGLTPGNYDLAVFAWSLERAGFVAPRTVRVTVRP